jgi:hypothetical protein
MQAASQDKIDVVKELLTHPYIDTKITDKVSCLFLVDTICTHFIIVE